MGGRWRRPASSSSSSRLGSMVVVQAIHHRADRTRRRVERTPLQAWVRVVRSPSMRTAVVVEEEEVERLCLASRASLAMLRPLSLLPLSSSSTAAATGPPRRATRHAREARTAISGRIPRTAGVRTTELMAGRGAEGSSTVIYTHMQWAHGRLLPQGHGHRHRRSRGASRPPRPREVPQVVVEEGSRALWRMVEAAGVVPLWRAPSSSRHSSRSRRRGARVSLR